MKLNIYTTPEKKTYVLICFHTKKYVYVFVQIFMGFPYSNTLETGSNRKFSRKINRSIALAKIIQYKL